MASPVSIQQFSFADLEGSTFAPSSFDTKLHQIVSDKTTANADKVDAVSELLLTRTSELGELMPSTPHPELVAAEIENCSHLLAELNEHPVEFIQDASVALSLLTGEVSDQQAEIAVALLRGTNISYGLRALEKIITDENPRITRQSLRRDAIDALGECDSDKARHILFRAVIAPFSDETLLDAGSMMDTVTPREVDMRKRMAKILGEQLSDDIEKRAIEQLESPSHPKSLHLEHRLCEILAAGKSDVSLKSIKRLAMTGDQRAIKSLAESKAPGATKALGNVLTDCKTEHGREIALELLAQSDGYPGIEEDVEPFLESDNTGVNLAAVRSLGIVSDSAADKLRNLYLEHRTGKLGHEDLGLEVVKKLAKHGDPEDIAQFAKSVDTESAPKIRAQMLRALGENDYETFKGVIKQRSGDVSGEVQAEVLRLRVRYEPSTAKRLVEGSLLSRGEVDSRFHEERAAALEAMASYDQTGAEKIAWNVLRNFAWREKNIGANSVAAEMILINTATDILLRRADENRFALIDCLRHDGKPEWKQGDDMVDPRSETHPYPLESKRRIAEFVFDRDPAAFLERMNENPERFIKYGRAVVEASGSPELDNITSKIAKACYEDIALAYPLLESLPLQHLEEHIDFLVMRVKSSAAKNGDNPLASRGAKLLAKLQPNEIAMRALRDCDLIP